MTERDKVDFGTVVPAETPVTTAAVSQYWCSKKSFIFRVILASLTTRSSAVCLKTLAAFGPPVNEEEKTRSLEERWLLLKFRELMQSVGDTLPVDIRMNMHRGTKIAEGTLMQAATAVFVEKAIPLLDLLGLPGDPKRIEMMREYVSAVHSNDTSVLDVEPFLTWNNILKHAEGRISDAIASCYYEDKVEREEKGDKEKSWDDSKAVDSGMATAAMGTPNATPAVAGGGEETAEEEGPGVST